MKYLKQLVNLIITDENTDRDQIERILGSLNDEPPEDWVKIWNDDYIFLYRKKNHAERRPHKIALNWLEDSLKYLED